MTQTETKTNMMDAALEYARRGWPVFPCHTVRDGRCSCGNPTCNNKAKHPLTKNGLKDATTDEAIITAWWTRWPCANIGYALPTDMAVLDVDIKRAAGKYGDETLSEYESEYGKLPDTVVAITGSGGLHYYFRVTTPVKNRTGFLPSLDSRGVGGYVLLPPSLHECGRRYEWEASSDPDDTEIAEIPETLIKFINAETERASNEVPETIPEGARNDTLFRLACSLRAKGMTELEIAAAIQHVNKRCDPPLQDRELRTLVHSAARYQAGELSYVANMRGGLRPPDYTDSGNSVVFTREHKDKLIFVQAIGWMYWTGRKWKQGDLKAIKYGKELAGGMLEQAKTESVAAQKLVPDVESAKNETRMKEYQQAESAAKKLMAHAIKTRQAAAITNMLKLSEPELHVELDRLDSDPFTLNTPTGTIDLRTGYTRSHDPTALCANITKVAPDTENAQMWKDFLSVVTCGDTALEDFLQQLAGMAAIGKVFMELLTIAHGEGRNGKSTFFNALLAVLGDYGGTIAAEVLTTDKQNKGASLATLKGKRLVIAAELEEGRRLSSSVVKQLSSSDPITAEKKYKDPENFTPTHNVVLYTNHKPRVSASDTGTWRRLVVVPFKANIPTGTEVKNYGDELVNKAGGAILTWIIEGARRFHQAEHKLTFPPCVQTATASYRADNDWLSAFIDECCTVGQGQKEKAGVLYESYRQWAIKTGEYTRHKGDFVSELERRGYENHKTNQGAFWHGISFVSFNENPFTTGA